MLLFLHFMAGGAIALAAICADPLLGLANSFGPTQFVLLGIGLSIIAVGYYQPRKITQLSSALCLSIISLFLILALGEGSFRWIAFDFVDEAKAWRAMPPFYRQPTVPTGAVFFRRPGPDRWTGQVLHTYVTKIGLPSTYRSETPIAVEYDPNGFRNPMNLTSWRIAVAGDSFTELGQLGYEQLFTTVMARELKTTVRNLGTSYTGPLTQLSYLQDYGVSAATKHAVIVFFEGNDPGDLAGEYGALLHWQSTGQRDYRDFKKQSSLVKFLFQKVSRWANDLAPRPYYRNVVTAYYKAPAGRIPVTLVPPDAVPGKSDLSAEMRRALELFFAEYERFGKERRLTLWLAYMPSKLRVLHGQLEFSAETLAKIPKLKQLKSWQPSDLPALMAELCRRHRVQFVDLLPMLRHETIHAGELPYNALNDTHLNARGSLIVGQELVRHFRQQNFTDALD